MTDCGKTSASFEGMPSWGLLGESVCGAVHFRNNKGNQDALGWLPVSGRSGYAVMSVSDGHGGSGHFRSGTGARLAVEASLKTLAEFMEESVKTGNHSVVKSMAEERLPLVIHRRWQEAVALHLEQNPLAEREAALLSIPGRENQFAGPGDYLPVYGATLLSVLVTPTYALILQLGDGDILTVTDEGDVQRPLPGDARLFAEETTSLGMTGAWKEFRLCFQVLSRHYPALFLLSTDGYVNCFPSDDDFYQVGRDILQMINSRGVEDIRNNLSAWLTEASHLGSGDDATLGIIFRSDVVHRKTNRGEE